MSTSTIAATTKRRFASTNNVSARQDERDRAPWRSAQPEHSGRTEVLDGSMRDAVEKVGGELFTIVHKPEEEDSGTAA